MGPMRISFLVKSPLTRRPRIMVLHLGAGGRHRPQGESADRFLTSLFLTSLTLIKSKKSNKGRLIPEVLENLLTTRMKFSSDSRITHRHQCLPGRIAKKATKN